MKEKKNETIAAINRKMAEIDKSIEDLNRSIALLQELKKYYKEIYNIMMY